MNRPIISVTHSCGDCGFVGQEPGFGRHLNRLWHRLVVRQGLEVALDTPAATHSDARRAVAIFREGAKP